MISNKHFFIKKSQWLRKEIFEMVIRVNQGHIASAFSQCEILISLFYGDILNYKKNKPKYEDRDLLHTKYGLNIEKIITEIG